MEQYKKWLFLAITTACYILFGYYFITYRKITAGWFGINIVIIAAVIAAVVLLVVRKLEWFEKNYFSSSWRMYLIVVVGFVMSLFLGIRFTENVEVAKSGQDYNYSATRTGGYYFNNVYPMFQGGSGSNSVSSSSIDIDDDAGEAVAYLVLIIIVILLVIGSAFIPHFWVVACAITIGLMGLLTYRELTLKERLKSWF